MSLMDAPKFDAEGARRRSMTFYGILAALLLFLVGMWLFTGRPLDYPWTWWTYWSGERDVNQFLLAVEGNDLPRAYGIYMNDFDWKSHPQRYERYPFARFSEDWGPNSMQNDYGTISSHRVVARKIYGGNLIVGCLVNGRKSKPMFLIYDHKDHTLGDSPVELTLTE